MDTPLGYSRFRMGGRLWNGRPQCLDLRPYFGAWIGFPHNVGKTIINHPMFDGLNHPFMVILGMVFPHSTLQHCGRITFLLLYIFTSRSVSHATCICRTLWPPGKRKSRTWPTSWKRATSASDVRWKLLVLAKPNNIYRCNWVVFIDIGLHHKYR